jgi:hypothetical protein
LKKASFLFRQPFVRLRRKGNQAFEGIAFWPEQTEATAARYGN